MYEMRENCSDAWDIFTSIFGNYAALVETFTFVVVVASPINDFRFSSGVSCILMGQPKMCSESLENKPGVYMHHVKSKCRGLEK